MSDLVEFVNQLVVLPRICELCLEHPAVYYYFGTWPDMYLCRLCLDREISPLGDLADGQTTPHDVGRQCTQPRR